MGAVVTGDGHEPLRRRTGADSFDASARPGTMEFPGRTRPLCGYPSYARYDGSGSLEDATNFVGWVN